MTIAEYSDDAFSGWSNHKTMYELNKHYGWSKFIIVVPSIAIREGVYKSFQTTQGHFAEKYGKKIRFFIYNFSQLTGIDRFAKGLQSEIAEAVADRPKAVTVELFKGKIIKDDHGNEQTIDMATAQAIQFDMIVNGYSETEGIKDFLPCRKWRDEGNFIERSSSFRRIYDKRIVFCLWIGYENLCESWSKIRFDWEAGR